MYHRMQLLVEHTHTYLIITIIMTMMPFIKSLVFNKFHRLKNYSAEELQKKMEMEKANGAGGIKE